VAQQYQVPYLDSIGGTGSRGNSNQQPRLDCRFLVRDGWALDQPDAVERVALDEWYAEVGGPIGVLRQWGTARSRLGCAWQTFFPEKNPAETIAALREFM
jgi:hypothetical protein